MKLIYCKNCDSVVRLMLNKKRSCECKKTWWVYIDVLNAIYFWKYAHPFWIDNNSFWVRIREDPVENTLYNIKNSVDDPKWCDIWWEFKAFSLLRQINWCSKTFKKVTQIYFKNFEKWNVSTVKNT